MPRPRRPTSSGTGSSRAPASRRRSPQAAAARRGAPAARAATAGCCSSRPTTRPAARSACAATRPRWPTGTELLERLVLALSRPGVDGVLGTAGHPGGPAAAGCAGGQGRHRLDEPRRPAGRGLRAGRPVHRLRRRRDRRVRLRRRQDALPASTSTTPARRPRSRRCARAVTELAGHGLMAMVEPFMSRRVDGHGPQRPDRRGAWSRRSAIAAGARRDQRLHLAEAAGGDGHGAR